MIMNKEDIFLQANRLKLRWDYRGQCSVEDLWDLSLEELNSIYSDYLTRLNEKNEAPTLFLIQHNDNEVFEQLKLKVEIVTHVFGVKQKELEALQNESLKAQQKQKLLAILAEKEDEKLMGLSVEELTSMIENL
jgi:hypothetical protein